MNRTRTLVTAGAIAVALTLPLGPANAGSNQSSSGGHSGGYAVGLAGGKTLVAFDLAKPGRPAGSGKVTGLTGDTSLVGIDFRVQDKQLYGVGDAGGVYTLSSKAKATKVSQLTVALSGSRFGVDFNPAADRLRVVSDTGQNLRHDVNPGGATIADGTLTYPPATTPASGISAAAYTNNDLDAATATTLFDLDTAMDQVAVQAPANAGSLSATGKLGVDAGSDAGFDIAGTGNRGWAALSVGGTYRLYSVELLTGRVTSKGSFPRSLQVSDLAVPIGK
ncbi:MAG: DUF4394 domain-containing protein [Marmoricola sp.]